MESREPRVGRGVFIRFDNPPRWFYARVLQAERTGGSGWAVSVRYADGCEDAFLLPNSEVVLCSDDDSGMRNFPDDISPGDVVSCEGVLGVVLAINPHSREATVHFPSLGNRSDATIAVEGLALADIREGGIDQTAPGRIAVARRREEGGEENNEGKKGSKMEVDDTSEDEAIAPNNDDSKDGDLTSDAEPEPSPSPIEDNYDDDTSSVAEEVDDDESISSDYAAPKRRGRGRGRRRGRGRGRGKGRGKRKRKREEPAFHFYIRANHRRPRKKLRDPKCIAYQHEHMVEMQYDGSLPWIDTIIDYRVVGEEEDAGADEKSPSDGSGAHKLPDFERVEVLVKYFGLSHYHNRWVALRDAKDPTLSLGIKKVDRFIKDLKGLYAWKADVDPEQVEAYYINRELERENQAKWAEVERVIGSRPSPEMMNEAAGGSASFKYDLRKDTDLPLARVDSKKEICEYFIKWKGLPYSECTWETWDEVMVNFPDEFASYRERLKLRQRRQKQKRDPADLTYVELKKDPAWVRERGNKLREYQLHGINWLTHKYCSNVNCILADEMGLGKTIQTICHIGQLFRQHHVQGPYLVISPLSALPAWQREFKKWAPYLNTVVYNGNTYSRQILRDFEVFGHKIAGGFRATKTDVLLTTYEFATKDKYHLNKLQWKHLLVDEAHRLKNPKAQLYKVLSSMSFAGKVLITGTPLQNSMKELWALLNFLHPKKFGTVEDFEETYQGMHDEKDGKTIQKLHTMLEPYLIRRIKKDVLKSLPKKIERILHVEMSALQKKFYAWILARNYKALNQSQAGRLKGSAAAANRSSLMHTLTELKKCCNHCYLFPSGLDEAEKMAAVEENKKTTEQQDTNNIPLRGLLLGSGKLALLDKLLTRLKETGHRVLIFSQMVRMLDVLAEYLRLKKYNYQRLDGTMASSQRNRAIDQFNKKDSKDFCFLLSTRAGGLGINLATADTVIIFDSDWNPQNDLQALARCHRIGQEKTVNTYRLVTKDTVEEEIIERAKKKMILDHLVIQRMDTSGHSLFHKQSKKTAKPSLSSQDLSRILKFGAKRLFSGGKKASKGASTNTTRKSSRKRKKTAKAAAAAAAAGGGAAAATAAASPPPPTTGAGASAANESSNTAAAAAAAAAATAMNAADSNATPGKPDSSAAGGGAAPAGDAAKKAGEQSSSSPSSSSTPKLKRARISSPPPNHQHPSRENDGAAAAASGAGGGGGGGAMVVEADSSKKNAQNGDQKAEGSQAERKEKQQQQQQQQRTDTDGGGVPKQLQPSPPPAPAAVSGMPAPPTPAAASSSTSSAASSPLSSLPTGGVQGMQQDGQTTSSATTTTTGIKQQLPLTSGGVVQQKDRQTGGGGGGTRMEEGSSVSVAAAPAPVKKDPAMPTGEQQQQQQPPNEQREEKKKGGGGAGGGPTQMKPAAPPPAAKPSSSTSLMPNSSSSSSSVTAASAAASISAPSSSPTPPPLGGGVGTGEAKTTSATTGTMVAGKRESPEPQQQGGGVGGEAGPGEKKRDILAQIDKILQRNDEGQKADTDRFLSNFAVSSFESIGDGGNAGGEEDGDETEDDDEVDEDDERFWDSIIPKDLIPQEQLDLDYSRPLLRSERRKKLKQKKVMQQEEDDEEDVAMDEDDDETSEVEWNFDSDKEEAAAAKGEEGEDKKKKKAEAVAEAGGNSNKRNKRSSRKAATQPTAAQVKQLFRYIMLHGNVERALVHIYKTLWRGEKVSPKNGQKLGVAILQKCRKVIDFNKTLARGSDKKKSTTVELLGANMNAASLMNRIVQMEALRKEVKKVKDPYSFRIPNFSPSVPAPRWTPPRELPWTPEQDSALLIGVYFHGLGAWDEIIKDMRLGLVPHLCVPPKEGGDGILMVKRTKEEVTDDEDEGGDEAGAKGTEGGDSSKASGKGDQANTKGEKEAEKKEGQQPDKVEEKATQAKDRTAPMEQEGGGGRKEGNETTVAAAPTAAASGETVASAASPSSSSSSTAAVKREDAAPPKTLDNDAPPALEKPDEEKKGGVNVEAAALKDDAKTHETGGGEANANDNTATKKSSAAPMETEEEGALPVEGGGAKLQQTPSTDTTEKDDKTAQKAAEAGGSEADSKKEQDGGRDKTDGGSAERGERAAAAEGEKAGGEEAAPEKKKKTKTVIREVVHYELTSRGVSPTHIRSRVVMLLKKLLQHRKNLEEQKRYMERQKKLEELRRKAREQAEKERAARNNDPAAKAFQAGNYREAIKEWTKTLQEKPAHPVTLFNRGVAFMHIREYARAMVDFQKALSVLPHNPTIRAALEKTKQLLHKEQMLKQHFSSAHKHATLSGVQGGGMMGEGLGLGLSSGTTMANGGGGGEENGIGLWKVIRAGGLYIQSAMTLKSSNVGVLREGEILRGVRLGAWLKHERGYSVTEQGGRTYIRRMRPFSMDGAGSSSDFGLGASSMMHSHSPDWAAPRLHASRGMPFSSPFGYGASSGFMPHHYREAGMHGVYDSYTYRQQQQQQQQQRASSGAETAGEEKGGSAEKKSSSGSSNAMEIDGQDKTGGKADGDAKGKESAAGDGVGDSGAATKDGATGQGQSSSFNLQEALKGGRRRDGEEDDEDEEDEDEDDDMQRPRGKLSQTAQILQNICLKSIEKSYRKIRAMDDPRTMAKILPLLCALSEAVEEKSTEGRNATSARPGVSMGMHFEV